MVSESTAAGRPTSRHIAEPVARHRALRRLPLSRLRERPVALYYLAAPLFAVVDFAGHVNLRVVFLAGQPELRIAYYLVCLALGAAMLRADRRTATAVGLAECTVNLTLLAMSVMVPLADLPARVMDGGSATNPFTPLFLVNLVLSSAILLRLFYTNPLVRNSRRLDR